MIVMYLIKKVGSGVAYIQCQLASLRASKATLQLSVNGGRSGRWDGLFKTLVLGCTNPFTGIL